MRSQKLGFMISVLLLAGTIASAQEFRGRVQGAVTDSTGALVPGANLILRNTETGIDASRTSNSEGR